MLKIRFQRIGRKKLPFFRIVVAEHSNPVKGRFIEIIGHFNPATKELTLEKDRLEHWISKGAQPSERVARMSIKEGVKVCEKFVQTRQMKPSKAEAKAAEAAKKEAEEKAKAEAEAAELAKKEAEEKAKEAETAEEKVEVVEEVAAEEKTEEKEAENKS